MSTAAIALLQQSLKTCKENAEIQRGEGRDDEAVNSEKNAESYTDALIILELEYAQQRYHQRHSPKLANITINN